MGNMLIPLEFLKKNYTNIPTTPLCFGAFFHWGHSHDERKRKLNDKLGANSTPLRYAFQTLAINVLDGTCVSGVTGVLFADTPIGIF